MCLSVWSEAQLVVGMVSVNSSVCSSVVCTLCTLQDNVTALMCAAYVGYTAVVQVLLSRQDVDINMRDEVCPSQWKWTYYHVTVDKVQHQSFSSNNYTRDVGIAQKKGCGLFCWFKSLQLTITTTSHSLTTSKHVPLYCTCVYIIHMGFSCVLST